MHQLATYIRVNLPTGASFKLTPIPKSDVGRAGNEKITRVVIVLHTKIAVRPRNRKVEAKYRLESFVIKLFDF